MPKALNQRWESQTIVYHEVLIANETIPSEAVSFSVSLDGVMIGMKPECTMEQAEPRTLVSGTENPLLDSRGSDSTSVATKKSMKTEWREASCGTISFFDAEGERISTLQYGQMPEHKKATLKTLLRMNTETILQQRRDLKLVHLADGAQDNWTFFDEEMPLGFQLTEIFIHDFAKSNTLIPNPSSLQGEGSRPGKLSNIRSN